MLPEASVLTALNWAGLELGLAEARRPVKTSCWGFWAWSVMETSPQRSAKRSRRANGVFVIMNLAAVTARVATCP
jgi:hypothetical protein